ncbi:MAG: hypothetical protein J6U93_01415 [Alistipes sp.]|nr:hypothetical protein [Alistipes sp.]
MKIKPHKYGIGARLTFDSIERLSKRRLGKSPDDGKMSVGTLIIVGATIALVNFDFLPAGFPCRELITVALSVAFMGLGLYLEYRRLAPRTRWRKAMYATGMIASAWSLLPWIFYFMGEVADKSVVLQLFIASLAMWGICLGCVLRHRYIRRRSQQEIAFMRMREKRRRREMIMNGY